MNQSRPSDQPVILPNRFGLLFYTLLLAFVYGIQPIRDFDIWWHLASGFWMMSHHQIPFSDPFSYTRPGAPWLHHEWGASLLFSFIWQQWGTTGLILMKALLLWGILYATGRSIQIVSKSGRVPFVSLFFLGYLLLQRVVERPHLFTALFLSLMLFWVVSRGFHLQKIEKKDWLIPLMFVCWTNIHWGCLVGLGLLFLFWLMACLQSREEGCRHRFLFTIVVLSACALLINPFFTQVYTFPFHHLGMQAIMQRTLEWRSPFTFPYVQVPFFIFLGTLALMIGLWVFTSPARLLVLTPLVYLALRHARYTDMLELMSLPWMVQTVSVWMEKIKPVLQNKMNWFRVGFVFVLLGLFLRFGIPVTPKGELTYRNDLGVDRPFNFFNGVTFLKENGLEERIFHYFELGGYLMLADYPVFMDGRTPIYGDEFFLNAVKALQDTTLFEELYKQWDFGIVYLMRNPAGQSNLPSYLAQNSAWELVYVDDVSFIFLDKRTQNQHVIDQYRINEEIKKAIFSYD